MQKPYAGKVQTPAARDVSLSLDAGLYSTAKWLAVGRGSPAGRHRALIEEPVLHSPAVPARAGVPGERLEVRAVAQCLDTVVDLVRLPTVLPSRSDHQLLHSGRFALRLAACRQQAHFRIGP